MIRQRITDPWREVSWDEAINHAASEFRRIQARHGRDAVGGITSSRCTNEETWLVQKLVRAAFGTNNVDTCARVCHSPTGYGLKQTLGESAGTQTFDSVMHTDVVIVMGANPSSGHPVFASRLKRRLRQGARLIVIDPRRIELVSSPHIKADFHLQVRPGTNTALLSSLAHVIATENLIDEAFVAERCEEKAFREWRDFVSLPRTRPRRWKKSPACRPATRARRGSTPPAATARSITAWASPSTARIDHRDGHRQPRHGHRQRGPRGCGVNQLRGQNNVQGSCDMGSFPHELPGYRHISDDAARALFERDWGVTIQPEPGLRIPNMFEAALGGTFKGLYCQGEDIVQSDPNTQHVAAALAAMECIVVQDLFLNETAKYAHVFLPGSSFLEKDGTFTNAERRISRVRKVMEPRNGKSDWEVTVALSNALGYPMNYRHPGEIMDEIARLTPTFAGVSYDKLDRLAAAMAVQRRGAGRHPHHAHRPVRARQGPLHDHQVRAHRRAQHAPLSAAAHHWENPVAIQRRRADPPHAQRHVAQRGRAGDPPAGRRGPRRGRGRLGRHPEPRRRDRAARHADRPGPAGRGIHHLPLPESGANVVTTDSSDWATNCPEYKVTAVQVTRVSQPSEWQRQWSRFADIQHAARAARESDAAMTGK